MQKKVEKAGKTIFKWGRKGGNEGFRKTGALDTGVVFKKFWISQRELRWRRKGRGFRR